MKWAGTFRRTEKNIGVNPLYISTELRNLLDDSRCWIKYSSYPPREIAIRLHHRLVKIHPFPNGNGRHSRIMADVILKFVLKQPPIDWAGGENLQNMTARRKKYIEALRAADAHDYSLLLEFAGLPVCNGKLIRTRSEPGNLKA